MTHTPITKLTVFVNADELRLSSKLRAAHNAPVDGSGDLRDLQFLNTLKHRVRHITKLLDETGVKTYPASLESHEVKHAVVVLLEELCFHCLLPDGVTCASASHQTEERERS